MGPGRRFRCQPEELKPTADAQDLRQINIQIHQQQIMMFVQQLKIKQLWLRSLPIVMEVYF